MMQKPSRVIATLFAAACIAAFAGCEKDDSMENAGEEIDEMVDEAGEELDEAAEEATDH